MYQTHIFKRIIDVIPGMDRANEHSNPSSTSVTLTKDVEGEKRKETWEYRPIIGMLYFLANSTMPEFEHTVHQCTRFCADPKASHEIAVKHIVRYQLNIRNKNGIELRFGLNMKPDINRGLEVYVDASFAGDWETPWSDDPKSVISRTAFVIKYANCPIMWASKLQAEIALSSTEVEYIALS
eukprot:10918077-Ditylum_brightwellii.AAC.1